MIEYLRSGSSLDELVVADPPEAWAAAGFDVDPDGTCRVGPIRIRLVGRDLGAGVIGWGLRDLPPGAAGDLDGIPTTTSTHQSEPASVHPNGVVAIDHVVLLSPNLARTVAALADIGLEPRRERDGELGGAAIRQIFYRFGPVILEVVGTPGAAAPGPSTLWGITFVVSDIEASAEYFAGNTSRIKDAVQPGRRITTLRHRDLGLSVRTALISAHVGRGAPR